MSVLVGTPIVILAGGQKISAEIPGAADAGTDEIATATVSGMVAVRSSA
ncbi:hypothetical protein GCM10009851_37080 [Herbiconiux moechotypicola]|uniref:Uncharacterized protein n=1 Tax=Herbiconiux moechotypicola TaxID=637393 RepID=A0ABN3E4T5_9MICO